MRGFLGLRIRRILGDENVLNLFIVIATPLGKVIKKH